MKMEYASLVKFKAVNPAPHHLLLNACPAPKTATSIKISAIVWKERILSMSKVSVVNVMFVDVILAMITLLILVDNVKISCILKMGPVIVRFRERK
jgi:hypothetical protein